MGGTGIADLSPDRWIHRRTLGGVAASIHVLAVAFLTSGPEATGADLVRRLARTVYDYVTP
ncbi:hypothetical protein [Micromonospora halophytica]|uniref:Uncharacterized protein n=1 Tax=Micromonospora halophytica TaxID=47864 RepID=A0A1C5HBS9_9ACTN|nr:hypothetical protein [Micromonospora halophytica]SCG43337.1 hypothetical protein GA0070560_103428 [Micromonospora halophytica]